MNQLRTIKDADLQGKVVLVRVDHNVVKKGIIHDPYRIDATIPTLFNIVSRGGKLILMTHVGRPKNKKTGEINISKDSSVEPIIEYLLKKLQVQFVIPDLPAPDNFGIVELEKPMKLYVDQLRKGEIDGLYLPNTRWFKGEEAKDETADLFAQELASLADIYVNDAFGSWQAHASTVLVAKYLPSYAGFLMLKEVSNLSRIYEPQRPFVAVVAGSKFDTKIEPLYALLKQADYLVLGGVMYNAYLCAKYGFSIKGIDEEDIRFAKEFVEFAKDYPGKILELKYIVESDTMDGKIEGKYRTHNILMLNHGTQLEYVLDVAKESFNDPEIHSVFHKACTTFVNAVMGFTPYFNEGTIALDQLIDDNPNGVKLYGGGDTLQELKRLLPGLYISAIDSPLYYIFTGGGAVLKAIEEGTPYKMKPIEALLKK
ncbi:MAG: phosphoglycerate kinase [Bacteroidota bacterium]